MQAIIVDKNSSNCQSNWQDYLNNNKNNIDDYKNIKLFTVGSVIQVTNNTTGLNSIDDVDDNKNLTKIQKLRNWKNSIFKRYRERYRNMKCFHWNKINKQKKKNIEKNDPINLKKKKNICSRFTAAFCRFVYFFSNL